MSSGRAAALLLVPAAVALAVVMLVLRVRLEPPTVPAYVLEDGGPAVLTRDGRFEMVVDPTGQVTGAVGVRAFLVQDDTVRPWDPPVEVVRGGTVRVEGPVDRLFAGVPAGEWDVALAVGRPETLPTAAVDVLRARGTDAGAAAWRLVRMHVRLAQ
ncbi:MAG TPA: hypothetical protein VF765_35930 [Polyangiaceae bacterium]